MDSTQQAEVVGLFRPQQSVINSCVSSAAYALTACA